MKYKTIEQEKARLEFLAVVLLKLKNFVGI
jgi:hypothetical protein